jgi:hypothetical protein
VTLTGFAVPENPVRALTGANLPHDPQIVGPNGIPVLCAKSKVAVAIDYDVELAT